MTDRPLASQTGPAARDPLAPSFTGARLNLADLYRASVQAGGGPVIEGRTFTDCIIEGPALMLVLESVHFESTNFGPSGGDIRNILFRPLGERGIGAIPVRDCLFQNCHFDALGITGNDSLLQMLTEQVTVTPRGQA